MWSITVDSKMMRSDAELTAAIFIATMTSNDSYNLELFSMKELTITKRLSGHFLGDRGESMSPTQSLPYRCWVSWETSLSNT